MEELAYQDFPLDVFHKHIHQVTRGWTDSLYWLARRDRKIAGAAPQAKQEVEIGTLVL
jgi:hypothetical protein